MSKITQHLKGNLNSRTISSGAYDTAKACIIGALPGTPKYVMQQVERQFVAIGVENIRWRGKQRRVIEGVAYWQAYGDGEWRGEDLNAFQKAVLRIPYLHGCWVSGFSPARAEFDGHWIFNFSICLPM